MCLNNTMSLEYRSFSDDEVGAEQAGLPAIFNVTETEKLEWLNRATGIERVVVQGFVLQSGIDGRTIENREVTLVTLTPEGQYPQHVHKDSDARFIIVSGEATLLLGKTQRKIHLGDIIDIPKGTPHGFDTIVGQNLVFISIQSPPIVNHKTGDLDLQVVNLTDYI